jgi:hypothetical protein
MLLFASWLRYNRVPFDLLFIGYFHGTAIALPRLVVETHPRDGLHFGGSKYFDTCQTVTFPKMPKNTTSKIYSVAVGRKPGLYKTWAQCQAQVCTARFNTFLCFDCAKVLFVWLVYRLVL